jgi:hypothetical protein
MAEHVSIDRSYISDRENGQKGNLHSNLDVILQWATYLFCSPCGKPIIAVQGAQTSAPACQGETLKESSVLAKGWNKARGCAVEASAKLGSRRHCASACESRAKLTK